MAFPVSHQTPHVSGESADDIEDPSQRHVLWRVWRVLRRRFWQVGVFVILLLPPLWLHLLSQPHLYMAVGSLLIEHDQAPSGGLLAGTLGLDPPAGEDFATQLHLLQGTVLIERVIEKENLLHSRLVDELVPLSEPQQPWLSRIMAILGIPKAMIPTDTDVSGEREAILARLVGHMRSHLRVRPVKNSHMVEIDYTSQDPVLSARVVNALVKNHIEWQMETRTAIMKRVTKLLVQRLDGLTDNLEQAENALEAFRKRSALLTSEEKSSIEWQQLQAVNDEYSMTLAKTMELQIRIQKLEDWIKSRSSRRPGLQGADLEIESSVVLNDGYADAIKKEKLISRLTERKGETSPIVMRLRKDLAKITANIHAEENRILATERQDLEATQGRLAKIEKRLVQEQKKFKDFQTKAVQLRKLEREAESNRELRDIFLKRFKETNILGDLDIPVIQLVNTAEPPGQAYSPRFGKATLWTVILGFLVGGLVVILIEVFDPTLKTPYETERAMDLPFMGWIPLLSGNNRKRILELMRSCSPGTAYGEALQGIRTSLMMIHVHEPVKAIMIVSCGVGDGRTELVRGLGKVCALDGERVLVLDADFRKLAKQVDAGDSGDGGLFGIIQRLDAIGEGANLQMEGDKPSVGLREIIMERIEKTPEGYYLLAPGLSGAHPTKILSSPHWPQIMRVLRGEFDRILVDTPPVLKFTDALLLGVHMEVVILLVKSAVTHKEHLLTARKRIFLSRTPLAGVILTQLDMKKHRAELREYGYS
ncbi:MAG: hypothetical protein HW380_3216 [Magnetococcales bacterium]|nr:hypothetical protein [Magnetococcales bacterium]HIJ82891.1 polysaccharide biosynthesis tyrosine autokinase [Magnetococcales bacterium]